MLEPVEPIDIEITPEVKHAWDNVRGAQRRLDDAIGLLESTIGYEINGLDEYVITFFNGDLRAALKRCQLRRLTDKELELGG